MPKSPKVSFGRTRAPAGSDEYMPPTGMESGGISNMTQAYPEPENMRDEAMIRGPMSMRNRRSRRISGPRNSSSNELEYDGT